MSYDCPKCRSDNTQKISVIIENKPESELAKKLGDKSFLVGFDFKTALLVSATWIFIVYLIVQAKGTNGFFGAGHIIFGTFAAVGGTFFIFICSAWFLGIGAKFFESARIKKDRIAKYEQEYSTTLNKGFYCHRCENIFFPCN